MESGRPTRGHATDLHPRAHRPSTAGLPSAGASPRHHQEEQEEMLLVPLEDDAKGIWIRYCTANLLKILFSIQNSVWRGLTVEIKMQTVGGQHDTKVLKKTQPLLEPTRKKVWLECAALHKPRQHSELGKRSGR